MVQAQFSYRNTTGLRRRVKRNFKYWTTVFSNAGLCYVHLIGRDSTSNLLYGSRTYTLVLSGYCFDNGTRVQRQPGQEVQTRRYTGDESAMWRDRWIPRIIIGWVPCLIRSADWIKTGHLGWSAFFFYRPCGCTMIWLDQWCMSRPHPIFTAWKR